MWMTKTRDDGEDEDVDVERLKFFDQNCTKRYK